MRAVAVSARSQQPRHELFFLLTDFRFGLSKYLGSFHPLLYLPCLVGQHLLLLSPVVIPFVVISFKVQVHSIF